MGTYSPRRMRSLRRGSNEEPNGIAVDGCVYASGAMGRIGIAGWGVFEMRMCGGDVPLLDEVLLAATVGNDAAGASSKISAAVAGVMAACLFWLDDTPEEEG